METRANYIAVGFFTLVAVVTVFAVIYWFGRYGEDDNLVPIDIRIRGSVSGLGPASLVQFNGIDVGRVSGLSLDSADPRYVIIHSKINQATPVRSDTRASIGIRGLSGGAFIQLEGGSPTAPALLGPGVENSGEVPVISGDPSALSDLLTRVNSIAARTDDLMEKLENFIQANSDTVTRTLNNAETFSQALAQNSDGIGRFMQSAGDVAVSLQKMSEKLDGSLIRVEEILAAVEPQAIRNTIQNVETFTASLAEQRDQIAAVVDTINNTADQLNQFTVNLNGTLEKVDGVVSAVDRETVIATISNINRSAERAEQLLSAFEGEGLNNTITDAQAVASQARRILDNVDENQVRTLIGDLSKASSDVSKLLDAIDAAKINEAVENISTAAEGAQTIVSDVAKVTAPLGARAQDIDRIVSDASELASRLNESSKRVDDILVQVGDLVGSGVTDGLMADVKSTLAQFRQTAANFDRQVSSIAGNVNAFTKRGLADTQGLIRDARQSLNQFDRVMRNLQSNPSSLITGAGGSRVRESSGTRVRR